MDREQHLNRVFHALSDPTRRAILRGIARKARTVGEIASPMPMSLAAVSKHLRVLEEAGLIRKKRDGRRLVCSIRLEPLESADEAIRSLGKYWESRLDELEAFLRVRRHSGEQNG
jgi:DNA-binding transcriptional ArsR family regulator